MAAEGGAGNLAKHYRETSFFGIVQVLRNLRTIRRQMRECRDDVARFAPDALILIDYPGFNMQMAEWAHAQGIRVFYYIAPKVWAWREYRVKAMRRCIDRLFVIFPFERGYFRSKGIEPVFEGNPLVDAIAARCAALPPAEEFRTPCRTQQHREKPAGRPLPSPNRNFRRTSAPRAPKPRTRDTRAMQARRSNFAQCRQTLRRLHLPCRSPYPGQGRRPQNPTP